MINENILGVRLREIRQLRNISLGQIEKTINITKSTLSNIERGIKPASLSMVITLADFFDVSVDYLVGRTDVPEVNKK